jgi:hypothetical protein
LQGPFADPHARLPQEPQAAAGRRAGQRRWRERQRARKGAEIIWLSAGSAAETATEPLIDDSCRPDPADE